MKHFDAIIIGTGHTGPSPTAARDTVFFTIRTDTKVQLFVREASDLIAQFQIPLSHGGWIQSRNE